MADLLKGRTVQMVLAELFEAGKLADLAAEDKELLLAAAAAAPAPAPEPEPPVRHNISSFRAISFT